MAAELQHWKVATALMTDDAGRLLLVENLRRGGRLDWSPPGGVVDAGESVLGALSREVVEETGLVVDSWSPLAYAIEVEFEARWVLRVEAYVANSWSGDVVIDDPDGIVQRAEFAATSGLARRLATSPPWVHEPIHAWVSAADALLHTYLVQPAEAGGYAVADRRSAPLTP